MGMSGVARTGLVAACVPWWIGACTLPVPLSGHELLVGYVEVDDAARRSRRITPGLDLSLHGPRPGLHLGWSDTSWFAAPTDADGADPWRPGEPPADGFRLPLGWQWSDGSTRKALGWLWHAPPGLTAPDRAVLAVHHGSVGLDITWATHAQGLSFGFGRSTLLVAPVDSDGVWLFDFSSAAPSSGRLVSLEGRTP